MLFFWIVFKQLILNVVYGIILFLLKHLIQCNSYCYNLIGAEAIAVTGITLFVLKHLMIVTGVMIYVLQHLTVTYVILFVLQHLKVTGVILFVLKHWQLLVWLYLCWSIWYLHWNSVCTAAFDSYWCNLVCAAAFDSYWCNSVCAAAFDSYWCNSVCAEAFDSYWCNSVCAAAFDSYCCNLVYAAAFDSYCCNLVCAAAFDSYWCNCGVGLFTVGLCWIAQCFLLWLHWMVLTGHCHLGTVFAGYCFLLFQDEMSVQTLIEHCIVDDEKLYWCVSSPTMKDKPVSVLILTHTTRFLVKQTV